MKVWLRIPLQLATLGVLACVALGAVVTGAYFYVEPSLPSADELRDVRFQTPLSVYSRDGRLMQQFGEQLRTPANLEEIPTYLVQGIIAAEDDRFYEHAGIDLVSTLRAVLNYGLQSVTGSSDRVAGGSTITQQITRTTNLLPRDYAVGRKIAEIFLAYRIENEFTKDEILELYLNTYFFGQRSYGVVSAARTYFNKELSELTLSEAAIIAGIPTAPSVNNPYNGPENARQRRAYVLRRMNELGFIDAPARQAALAEPIVSQRFGLELELEASYIAQMAYDFCERRFGRQTCVSDGLRITTTIDSLAQRAANTALRNALEAYDRDHGYRGPIGRFDLATIGLAPDDEAARDWPEGPEAASGAVEASADVLDTLLGDYPDRFGARAAVVLAVEDDRAEVYLRGAGTAEIGLDAVSWARPYINDDRQGSAPEVVGDVLAPGDIVRFRRRDDGTLGLAQVPEPGDVQNGLDRFVEGAIVSLDPMDGAVVALAGGYDFQHSPYNRVTQALRQPGSSFKPFFYLSALNNGYTLSSVINDAPETYYDETLERMQTVRNYEGTYYGPTRLREVLIKSLNASANRVIRDIGASYAANYVERFGFDPEPRDRNASLALGSMAVTPLELANGYAILANGGYAVGIADPDTDAVGPYFVERVEDAVGNVLYDAGLSVRMVCPEIEDDDRHDGETLIGRPAELYERLRCAERVESPQRIYLITDVLRDVVRRGSGARAGRAFPARTDLAGKTGTTNGPRDAWFAGFNADIVAVVRVGFDDDTRDLGVGEQGGVTAIPAWIDYMRVMLEGQPEHGLPRPTGLVERRINRDTGLIAADCNDDTMWEWYLLESQPERESSAVCFSGPTSEDGQGSGGRGSDPLFE